MIAQVYLLVKDSEVKVVARTKLCRGDYEVVAFLANHYPHKTVTWFENILLNSSLFQSFPCFGETHAKGVIEKIKMVSSELSLFLRFFAYLLKQFDF